MVASLLPCAGSTPCQHVHLRIPCWDFPLGLWQWEWRSSMGRSHISTCTPTSKRPKSQLVCLWAASLLRLLCLGTSHWSKACSPCGTPAAHMSEGHAEFVERQD